MFGLGARSSGDQQSGVGRKKVKTKNKCRVDTAISGVGTKYLGRQVGRRRNLFLKTVQSLSNLFSFLVLLVSLSVAF